MRLRKTCEKLATKNERSVLFKQISIETKILQNFYLRQNYAQILYIFAFITFISVSNKPCLASLDTGSASLLQEKSLI